MNITDKKRIKRLVDQIEAHKNRIAKERDSIRDLITELEDIDYSVDEAVRDFEHALDTLSQYL